ncbi:MAG TPA: alpha/beta hydrolase [Dehalococcoidia bacterium]|nr:alpha/beta hydrolase [Dehalococcoidia bacterium]
MATIGVAITLAVYIGLSIFGAVRVMEIPRLPLTGSPASVGLDYEDITFISRDDEVRLGGWYIPGEGKAIIVIVHGGFQNRIDQNVDTLGLARDLVAKGYDILLFDLRGRGESAGKGLSLSNIERDIGGAVDYLINKGYEAKNIVLLGFCSGAASSCIFTSQESIGALILDGCFPTVRNIVTREVAKRGIPELLLDLFSPGILFMARVIYGYEVVDPLNVISRISCPIFFIHEDNDYFITSEEIYGLYQASNNPANEIWEVSTTEHSQAYKTHPYEYVEKIDNFLSVKLK